MSQKKKTTAQSKRPRKAPSNQTGGTAWGKKAAAAISGKMQSADVKKLILLNFPYIIAFYMVEKAAWLYRYCNGDTIVDRLMILFMNFGLTYKSYLPSFHPFDLLVGLIGAAALKAVIYFKGKNAKKYRQGEEYGSARWGNAKDIEPFIDPVFENNVLLTQTERLMMSGRPKHPKYARNKNVIVIGGSGSGKTRFFVKPNLMQMPEKVSYVCTDPKGTIIIECGKMLSDAGYKIKVLNTINFKKSMHYNPFHYIRSEKDILKLVNTIIANTKGDGEKSGEDFWVKAERLLYCALIGYIYYEAPEEEQNFSTLLEFINASEAREDDEEFKNPVDELFEDAIYVIPPVAASVFFIFLYSLFSTIEYYYQKTGFIAIATCICAVANLILNYIFINIYGYYAAGYTTVVCYIGLACLHYFFYRKVSKEEDCGNIYDGKLCVILSVTVLAVMLIMALTYQYSWVRYGFFVLVIAVAAIFRNQIKDTIVSFRK